jgi:UDP-glucose 4-epimerase
MNDRTVFFTGGAGFIGMHVVPMLLERGYRVRIFDNMFRGDRDKVAELVAAGGVELIDQDVRYAGAVHRAMVGCSHVIHFAAVSINKSVADPYESTDLNMVGNHNAFAAAADHGVRRMVFASSASVYGDPTKLPMHEDDELSPLTPYRIAKRAGEDLLGFYQRTTGLSWIALRFFNVYRPGQKTTAYYPSVINHFVNRLRNGQPRSSTGGANSRWTSSTSRTSPAAPSPRWSPSGTTSRSTSAPVWTPRSPSSRRSSSTRSASTSTSSLSSTRAREVLGWQPTIPVHDGMRELVELTDG